VGYRRASAPTPKAPPPHLHTSHPHPHPTATVARGGTGTGAGAKGGQAIPIDRGTTDLGDNSWFLADITQLLTSDTGPSLFSICPSASRPGKGQPNLPLLGKGIGYLDEGGLLLGDGAWSAVGLVSMLLLLVLSETVPKGRNTEEVVVLNSRKNIALVCTFN
jgi:hypothetical protein